MAFGTDELGQPRNTFPARYPSRCWKCHEEIQAGDSIYRAGVQRRLRVFHADCTVDVEQKMHRHAGRWTPHPDTVKHRENLAPEKHGREPTPPTTPEAVPEPALTSVGLDRFQSVLEAIKSKFDERAEGLEESVKAQAETIQQQQEMIEKLDAKREVVIKLPDRDETTSVGQQHTMFPTLVEYASLGLNVSLKGPAGSGKTYAAEMLATALSVSYHAISIGPTTSQSQLIGYMNGAGEYVSTQIREAFEHGGVLLIDEMDAGNAGSLVIINAIIACKPGQKVGFADGMVARNDKCIFICAMNTYGMGADSLFVGRGQLDAATLNRWVNIDWDIDWEFTKVLAGNDEWTDHVASVYSAIGKAGVRYIIGPRQAISGAIMLAAGIARDQVEQDTIWAAMKIDDKVKVQAAMRA